MAEVAAAILGGARLTAPACRLTLGTNDIFQRFGVGGLFVDELRASKSLAPALKPKIYMDGYSMNSHRLLPHRLAGSVLALATVIGAPHALAFKNDHPVPLAQSPDWAVFLDKNCSATQITAHVAISTGDCITSITQLMYPKIYGYVQSDVQAAYQGDDFYPDSIGNVGIAFSVDFFNRFNEDLKPADILSYGLEKQLLVDGNDELTAGANLSLYSSTPGADLSVRQVTSTSWYWNDAGYQSPDSRPLIYRSVQKYRQLEPKRFLSNNINPLMAPDVLNYFYSFRRWQDQQVNKVTLLTSGLYDDPAFNISNPITSTDVGGGIFYKSPENKLALVGIISGSQTHVRLSHYWPWVYDAIKNKNMRAEAITFSRKVLGTGEWGSNDRKANIGDIFVYDNPYTNDVEFFRLINRGSDQRYWYFPINKKDNYYWQYLGTSLPTFEEAVGPEFPSVPAQRSEGKSVAVAVAMPNAANNKPQPSLLPRAAEPKGNASIEAIAVPGPAQNRPQPSLLPRASVPTGNASVEAIGLPDPMLNRAQFSLPPGAAAATGDASVEVITLPSPILNAPKIEVRGDATQITSSTRTEAPLAITAIAAADPILNGPQIELVVHPLPSAESSSVQATAVASHRFDLPPFDLVKSEPDANSSSASAAAALPQLIERPNADFLR